MKSDKGTEHEKRIQSKLIYRKWRLGLMEWQKRKLEKERKDRLVEVKEEESVDEITVNGE